VVSFFVMAATLFQSLVNDRQPATPVSSTVATDIAGEDAGPVVGSTVRDETPIGPFGGVGVLERQAIFRQFDLSAAVLAPAGTAPIVVTGEDRHLAGPALPSAQAVTRPAGAVTTTAQAQWPASGAVAASQIRGIVTYYGIEDGFIGGTTYCGGVFSPWDTNVAAVSPGRYPCGARLQVTEARSKRSVTVVVTDHCGDCDWDHLDLSRATFHRLGDIDRGRLEVTWSRIQ
jgi:hypothetical protein